MTKVDQFESVFKSAAKTVFAYQGVEIKSVLIVTDFDESGASEFGQGVREFLSVLQQAGSIAWRHVLGSEFSDAHQLLQLVEHQGPDLICTYRNLHSSTWKYPFSLGEHLDVLTQATPTPVMVLPHPEAGRALPHAVKNTDRVMAITAHLTGDHRLVSFAARFTEPKGTLFLTHVEDLTTFQRYIDVISKISTIDTDTAREEIRQQLLKEPRDYIASCRRGLAAEGLPLKVETTVTLGHHLADHKRLVEEQEIDLLVLNTKDEDQFAMHGLAYALAVDLRQIPLLML